MVGRFRTNPLFLYPIRVLCNEFAPVRLAVCLGFFGGVFGVVHILALADGMAYCRANSIGGIKKFGVLFGLQNEMHHFGHLFL